MFDMIVCCCLGDNNMDDDVMDFCFFRVLRTTRHEQNEILHGGRAQLGKMYFVCLFCSVIIMIFSPECIQTCGQT